MSKLDILNALWEEYLASSGDPERAEKIILAYVILGSWWIFE